MRTAKLDQLTARALESSKWVKVLGETPHPELAADFLALIPGVETRTVLAKTGRADAVLLHNVYARNSLVVGCLA